MSGGQLSFREIFAHLTSSEMERVPAEALPLSEAKNAMARSEVMAKVISTVLGLAASFTFTYFGVKWLVNAMDPTRKDKQEAQARVRSGGVWSQFKNCFISMLFWLRFVLIKQLLNKIVRIVPDEMPSTKQSVKVSFLFLDG